MAVVYRFRRNTLDAEEESFTPSDLTLIRRDAGAWATIDFFVKFGRRGGDLGGIDDRDAGLRKDG